MQTGERELSPTQSNVAYLYWSRQINFVTASIFVLSELNFWLYPCRQKKVPFSSKET